MSLSTSTTIVCDGCGGRLVGDENSNVAELLDSYLAVTQRAKDLGWKQTLTLAAKDVRHLCPACQKKGKENHEPNA